jgi:hypothetical protein
MDRALEPHQPGSDGEPPPDELRQPTIYVPAPEGHRRGTFHLENGAQMAIDMEPEELLEVVEAFLAGEGQLLELRDAVYGDLVVLTRHGVECLTHVGVAYVKNPAPKSDRLAVVRELPAGIRPMNREQRRRARRN